MQLSEAAPSPGLPLLLFFVLCIILPVIAILTLLWKGPTEESSDDDIADPDSGHYDSEF